jgi:ribosome-associated protein
MIYVTRTIAIDESESQQDFIRASGLGGRNVNKVATAVQLRFDVRNSPSLLNDVRERLISLAGRRLDEVLQAELKRGEDVGKMLATDPDVDTASGRI